MAGLRPVPESPPRAVIYIRQSIARDESVSPALQESACREYARQHGYQVTEVLEDLGISGRTWKRPAVVKTMELIETGHADVILLWKWSRISRSRRDWAIAADRVDVAGGRIESATEAVDVATATGRLTRGVLVEFAAFESDRMGEVWKEVQAKRLAEGRTPSGLPKAGYVWNHDEQVHQVDAVAGPALAEAYERYIAGEGFRPLAKWLNELRIPTTSGNLWSSTSLIRVMDAGFGAGHITWQGKTHPGIHEPLISPQMWQAYQDARAARHYVAPRTKVSKYLLTGILQCARCEGPMTGNKGNGRGDSYRCSLHKARGPMACTATSVQARIVEGKLVDWLRTVAEDVSTASIAAVESSARRLSAEGEVTRLSKELTRIDDAMRRLTVQVAEGLVAEAAYAGAWADLQDKRTAVEQRLEAQARLARKVDVDHQAVASGLLGDWDVLPLEVKRELLKSLVGGLRANTGGVGGKPGHRGAVSLATVEVLPAWSEEWLSI